ncbi:hypothetical protein HanXRQr2_Chr03g0109981 [Helianthus annuus]|uniref:Erythronate-4-phosphate dehydrogenase family protein n=1 Tax=Helianthus annuus TaxID=4232 RepID=A0A251V6B0_HELAN|nr:uncharacterized protein At1g01500 [Helianthus annuus]XP_022027232.1 uncharacterized protein At1g01500 [Helianthus annuus]KAF5814342.1 hypothetical protein HanXRQr2_Chr03g0109981 [Helianthus annuus]KAJ0592968.1 hypothetical protein HanHA300_Chr03g0091781 [Helianthus annuus]KAJ0607983.1 hypothetical protein HanHA89_Chr03g0103551 [Helianthus annuus]KAJ0768047.1 hypothetical protein HanLR1_Chr03g0096911 [Helianthus annuus]KAJ0943590.1 hypothetical protein HanPSC8_Chr03g0106521 [Helianthus annu
MGLHLLEKIMDTPTRLENGYNGPTHNSYYQHSPKSSLAWLDLRVFYIRISKCDINNESTPEYLTLNHVPLNRDTLLEVNGARTSIYSDGVTTLLRRDRIDKKSEEVTFVSTDSLRTTGSLKFEVFDKDVLLVSGVFDLCHGNGMHGESSGYVSKWRMECETDMVAGHGFLKGKHNMGLELDPPSIEVCSAGSFAGDPIILTKTLQLSCRKKQAKKGVLEAIPENETMANEDEGSSSGSSLVLKDQDYPRYKPEHEHHSLYPRMEYYENEDGELSWFNAGVRVGVGIGLSVCLGVGIGVGLLARTYHRTTRNFARRLI